MNEGIVSIVKTPSENLLLMRNSIRADPLIGIPWRL
jgi:hypothetical protein